MYCFLEFASYFATNNSHYRCDYLYTLNIPVDDFMFTNSNLLVTDISIWLISLPVRIKNIGDNTAVTGAGLVVVTLLHY